MKKEPRILLVGDYSKEVIAHTAIPRAIARATSALPDGGLEYQCQWLATTNVTSATLSEPDVAGIWVVPGSPYRNMDGALLAIRHARENGIPFLGTCGGFQHALIEYARNVLAIADADHAESSPDAAFPVIAKLQCSLINQSESIALRPGSALRSIYGADQITEAYQCSYGVNPNFEKRLEAGKQAFTAHSWDGAVRALELADHPFFMATLFQPERSASTGEAHPLIIAFLRAALAPFLR